MAQLGKLQFKIADSAGNALSGVAVEIRKQGAQVNGLHAGPTTSFTVDDPGAIVAGDQVSVDTNTAVRSVSSVAATNVTVGGLGFSNVDDDSRLTDITAPTIYNDAVGDETKANPLTTDSAGEAFCWVIGGKYDVLVSGGGATTKLYTDVVSVGGESVQSTIFSGTAYKMDTVRSLAVTDKLLDLQNATVSKFSVAGDGEIVAGAAGATHALTGSLSATTSISAGTTVAATTTVTGGTGVTATTGNITATAGDLDGRRLIMNNGTALTSTDFVIGAGWGTTATKIISGTAYDTRGVFSVTANGAGIAANPTVQINFVDGSFPVAPIPFAVRAEGSAPANGYWRSILTTVNAVQFEFRETPVAGTSYTMHYLVIG